MATLFMNWHQFITKFCEKGGVIEAGPCCSLNRISSPSVAIKIDPDGEIDVVGSFDRFACKEFVNAGCFFPQTSLPEMNLMALASSIGNTLFSKGIIGHVTVDLVSFPDPINPTGHPLFWAVDLNSGLGDFAAACFFFDFVMEGKMSK
jgi:hypothetical protein